MGSLDVLSGYSTKVHMLSQHMVLAIPDTIRSGILHHVKSIKQLTLAAAGGPPVVDVGLELRLSQHHSALRG